MKLVDFLSEERQKPDYLYHSTFKVFLPSIKKKGLVAGGEDFQAWSTTEERPFGIYLSETPENALIWGRQLAKLIKDPEYEGDWIYEDDIIKPQYVKYIYSTGRLTTSQEFKLFNMTIQDFLNLVKKLYGKTGYEIGK